METIYLLTREDYSAHRVIGAASSKEKADSMIAEIRAESDKTDCDYGFAPIEIEEFKIDVITDDLRACWHVSMDINGDNAKAGMRVCEPCDLGFMIGDEIKVLPGWPTRNKTGVWIQCKADSAEHAIKILNEKRAQALAEPFP